MSFLNGDEYDGQWKEDLCDGRGKYMYATGSVYEVSCQKNVFIKQRGNCIQGEWKEGRKHGSGTYNNANGSTFEGTWKNGVRHGVGVAVEQDKKKYR